MPKIRIGFSTDFNLKNEQVGVGTDNPTARLDIRGDILAVNISDTGGISTISRYDGFLNPNLTLSERTTELSIPNKGNLNTLSGEIIIEGDTTVEDDTPLAGGRLDSLTVTGKFDLPHGGSEDREDTPEKGSTRFNQDLGQLEFYTGLEWKTVGSYDGSGRGRAVHGGGTAAGRLIQYINIASTGNAINFGVLTEGKYATGAVSSSTRGVWGGGQTPAITNTLEYLTIASEGNAIDFGDMTVARGFYGTASSSTRGLFIGSNTPGATNVIDYIQIATLGNALDFGDTTVSSFGNNNGIFSSPTRGFVCSSTPVSDIHYVIISSTGNSIDFGDTTARGQMGTCANSVRGILSGGYISTPSTVPVNNIEFIALATGGNAQGFGQLTVSGYDTSASASSTRGIFIGRSTPSASNLIDYITLMTAGNAIDFGDLSATQQAGGSVSDSHGGLGGF